MKSEEKQVPILRINPSVFQSTVFAHRQVKPEDWEVRKNEANQWLATNDYSKVAVQEGGTIVKMNGLHFPQGLAGFKGHSRHLKVELNGVKAYLLKDPKDGKITLLVTTEELQP